MYSLIATLAFVGCIQAVPIELWSGPTRSPMVVPQCTNDLCRKLGGDISKPVQVNVPDGHYLYPTLGDNNPLKDRCFYSCSGGAASCQCCNDDSAIFYHERCNRCVRQEDLSMTVCPTTQPSTIISPCDEVEDKDYANKFCRNLATILGPEYRDMDGDFPFKAIADMKPSNPYSRDAFLGLPGFSKMYITCVAGMVGWCRPCPYWREGSQVKHLNWQPLLADDGVTPKLNCGRCY